MSHKQNRNGVFSIGVCAEEIQNSDLQNAYLFGYLTALEGRLERLEFRTEKLERVFRDMLDLSIDEDDEDDEDEDEYDELFKSCVCPCCEPSC